MKKVYSQEELVMMSPVDLFEMVLCGEVKRFPNRYWVAFEPEENIIPIVRYLIEEKLKLSEEELKTRWGLKLLREYKLAGMLNVAFANSTFALINTVYPNRFKPWEFNRTGSWTVESGIEAIRWVVEEKLKLSDEELKKQWSKNFVCQHDLIGAVQYVFSNNLFLAIDSAYPNRFKPWEFQMVSNQYWTNETVVEAVKWLIEEKLKLSEDELKEQWSYSLLKQHRLLLAVTDYFDGNLFDVIEAIYPNRFKPWEFQKVPSNFWTEETTIEALKWLIEEKLNLKPNELNEVSVAKLIREHHLAGSLKIFNGNSKKALELAYGGQQ